MYKLIFMFNFVIYLSFYLMLSSNYRYKCLVTIFKSLRLIPFELQQKNEIHFVKNCCSINFLVLFVFFNFSYVTFSARKTLKNYHLKVLIISNFLPETILDVKDPNIPPSQNRGHR